MKKTAVITGGSHGIGKAAAELFAEKGYIVYEISRSGSDYKEITHITADVTDEAAVKAAFERIADEAGSIDVLVNNAGFGISGAIEMTELSLAKKQLDVNFFGMLNCAKAVIPIMRKSGGGHIINLSSAAAILPVPYQGFYSASKAAVNALTLCLANEVKRFGIKVCAVMPGDVATNFTASRQKSEQGNELYESSISRAVSAMEKDERNGMTPEKIARVIFRLAQKKHPRPLTTVGGIYRLFAAAAKLLPAGFVNWAEGKMYG